MNLIKPSYYFLDDEVERDYALKLERCTRLAYKSEDKINQTSDDININLDESGMTKEDILKAKEKAIEFKIETDRIKFLSNIFQKGHHAVLEHFRVCFEITGYLINEFIDFRFDEIYKRSIVIIKELNNKFITLSYNEHNKTVYLSGNLRAFIDMWKYNNDMDLVSIKNIMNMLGNSYPIFFAKTYKLDDVKCVKLEEQMDDKKDDEDKMRFGIIKEINASDINDLEHRSYHDYKTVFFITNRGVSHEMVRSRFASFVQESTRFVSYDKDKFGNNITLIHPKYIFESIDANNKKYATQEFMMRNKNEIINIICETYGKIEEAYLELKGLGCPNDVARNVLPIGVKTEIAVTQTLDQWRYFFQLRTSKFVHPDFLFLSRPLLDDFKKMYVGMFNDINLGE